MKNTLRNLAFVSVIFASFSVGMLACEPGNAPTAEAGSRSKTDWPWGEAAKYGTGVGGLDGYSIDFKGETCWLLHVNVNGTGLINLGCE